MKSSNPQPAEILILAVDIGTSSTRTVLFTERADRVPGTMAQRKYSLRTTAKGCAELDPEELWRVFGQCLDDTMQAFRSLGEIRNTPVVAVGVSCFWHSLMGIDRRGQAVTPVFTWADTRCAPDVVALREEFDEQEMHARTGCMLRTPFWPGKLRWLRRTQPNLFSSVDRWVSPAEWFQLRVCGKAQCAHGMATGTGLYNPTALNREPELLESCRVDGGQLLPLGDGPSESLPSFARRYPELGGAKWYPAIGDGTAGNLGSGATRAGFAAVNVGTSAALRVVREGAEARAPFGLFCYRIDTRRYLVGGAVSNAGNLFDWCLKQLRVPADPAELEPLLADRCGPGHGLTVLPFWSGERSLKWREEVKGTIAGITAHTSALDLLQAVTDAGYYPLAAIADQVAEREPERLRIVLSGGIAKSASSVQRLADVLDRRLFPNDEPEASARGAAIFVLEKLGYEIPPFDRCDPIDPRPQAARDHREHRRRQEELDRLLFGGDG